jgi:cytochrome oxidase Cu insertion factor (SCO1/SenC/PrrC family)
VLADFLTTCQEVCPMTSVNVRDAAGDAVAAGLSSSVLFLEVTVDPQRDDPARLAAYQKLYGSRPAWDLATAGATGTAALWKFLGVYYAKVPADNPAPTDWLTGKPLTYDVNHQDVVIILGPDGHERWIAQGTPDTGGQQPPATLAHFLNDQGRANLASPQAQGPVWTTPDIDQALSRVTGRTITPRATADDTTASATTGG